ncbi:hypothetical protein PMI28_05923 [Pseudomonas sp. GM48]|nr:hypothetical protein PMI28_05923 [Pseudomonas sp. GM48]
MHDCPVGVLEAEQQKQCDQAKDKSMSNLRCKQWRKEILFAGSAIELHNGNSMIICRRPLLANLDCRLLLQIQHLILPER